MESGIMDPYICSVVLILQSSHISLPWKESLKESLCFLEIQQSSPKFKLYLDNQGKLKEKKIGKSSLKNVTTNVGRF